MLTKIDTYSFFDNAKKSNGNTHKNAIYIAIAMIDKRDSEPTM